MGFWNGHHAHDQTRRRSKKLIEAAVDLAYGEDIPPPDELHILWLCNRFPGSLPETGAIFDQDSVLINRMNVLGNVYSAVSHAANAVGEQIHTLNNGERRIIKWLRDEGLM